MYISDKKAVLEKRRLHPPFSPSEKSPRFKRTSFMHNYRFHIYTCTVELSTRSVRVLQINIHV